jgi:hypothetical protein
MHPNLRFRTALTIGFVVEDFRTGFEVIFPMFSTCGVQIGRSTSLLTSMISNISPLIFINEWHVFRPSNRAERADPRVPSQEAEH